MHVHPYLNFNGQCDEALKFYEKCLGAKVAFKMTIGESPMAKDMPPEQHNQILHASFRVGDHLLMCSDACCGHYQVPQGISISLNIDTAEEAERVFAALSENGNVRMPIQETFWAIRFGMLTDPFGIPWMINCEKPM